MDTPGKKNPARLERALAAGCMALLCIITFSNVLVRYLTFILRLHRGNISSCFCA